MINRKKRPLKAANLSNDLDYSVDEEPQKKIPPKIKSIVKVTKPVVNSLITSEENTQLQVPYLI